MTRKVIVVAARLMVAVAEAAHGATERIKAKLKRRRETGRRKETFIPWEIAGGIGLPGARGRFHQCHRGEMERTFGEVTA